VSHSSESKDSHDEAIPLLTEVLVTGSPTRSHYAPVPVPAAPVDTLDDVPVLEDVFEVRAANATAPAQPRETDDDVPVLDDVFEASSQQAPSHPDAPEAASKEAPEEAAAPSAPIGHEPVADATLATEPIQHATEAHVEPAHAEPVVRAAEPVKPVEAVEAVATPFTAAAALAADLSTSTPVHAHQTATLNPDALTGHLRGKFTAYLRGPGQEVIEERCRAAMQVHATWLVGQIAKEVGAVLEAQMSNWVREAVEEERKRQS
jgi:hypothetical protein